MTDDQAAADPTAAEVARVDKIARHLKLREWAMLVRAGGLNVRGLTLIRGRLDPGLAEFRHGCGCPFGGCALLVLSTVIRHRAELLGQAPEDDHLWAEIWADDRITAAELAEIPEHIDEIAAWRPPSGRRW